MTAAERWRSQLEAWAIPDHLLEAVDESPYGWPAWLWKRRSEEAATEDETPTTGVVRRLLGPHGSLLDIGAGRGRASLPLAAEGHRVTAVEKDPGMSAGLGEDAGGLPVEIVSGSWPEVAGRVGVADVALAAHVVYDVPDLGPFLRAMEEHARVAVVLELTESHPWASLGPYYRALHCLDRPEGPAVEDLVAVIREVTGKVPAVRRWEREGQVWFAGWEEVTELFGRRLVVPRERWAEVREVLERDVVEREGRLYVGSQPRPLATVWWRT